MAEFKLADPLVKKMVNWFDLVHCCDFVEHFKDNDQVADKHWTRPFIVPLRAIEKAVRWTGVSSGWFSPMAIIPAQKL